MKAAFLLAAPSSGSGKTTVARGLMALLRQQGYRVQPFKCGPDYIDTKFHEAACGRPSVNLDTFMASPEHIRQLFGRYTADANIAVVEGMMGLFDGYDRDRGSSAEVASVLGLPVVLVVDARSAAYSTAALLQGFLHFRAGVRVAGVIFNKVGSPRHQQQLRQVAAEVGVPCLGCIPRQAAFEQGSRYLGLDFSAEAPVDELLHVLAQSLDLPGLLACSTGGTSEFHRWNTEVPLVELAPASRRILVARNAESFSFIYSETLDLLSELGEVTFFDPEEDSPPALPIREGAVTNDGYTIRGKDYSSFVPIANAHSIHSAPSLIGRAGGESVLYLPGGYPEKHLEALMRAEGTRRFVREFAQAGGRIIAECGGMMYLCRSIITDDGEFPMCGVLPYSITARKADRHLSLGYRRLQLDGHELRGHEFHYTQFLPPAPPSAVQVFNASGEPVPTPILRHGNVLASYTHLSPEALLQLCR